MTCHSNLGLEGEIFIGRLINGVLEKNEHSQIFLLGVRLWAKMSFFKVKQLTLPVGEGIYATYGQIANVHFCATCLLEQSGSD